jgi:protein gp37
LLHIGRGATSKAGNPRDTGNVSGGSMTLAQWERMTQEQRAEAIRAGFINTSKRFNRTNENISWARWSWNPVTGCSHDCPYCYARDIAKRFYPEGFEPVFHPDRLGAPLHQRAPRADAVMRERNVFTVSMGDLFGKWIPQDWIAAVLSAAGQAPRFNFLFLTKHPGRLAEQRWPANAWVGTTVDRQARVKAAEAAFQNVRASVRWLSIEPFSEPLRFNRLELFNWLVIGARSRTSQAAEFQPRREWVEDLIRQAREAGCCVYIKPNLLMSASECLKEYPLAA